jgi:hypothetical protein
MSKVEMDVLDSVWEMFGTFNIDALVDITHDYPEWKRYENLFMAGSNYGELVKIGDFFENPDVTISPALQKYFNGIDPLYEEEDYLKDVKEIYLENESMKNAYN